MTTPTPTNPIDETNPFAEDYDITTIDNNLTPARAADVVQELLPTGQTVQAKDLINQELVVHHLKAFQGEFGPALFVVATDAQGVVLNTVLGGRVICPKLWACRSRLPVALKLIHVDGGQYGGYYDFE